MNTMKNTVESWKSLSNEDKQYWAEIARETGSTAWKAFQKDSSIEAPNPISIPPPPSGFVKDKTIKIIHMPVNPSNKLCCSNIASWIIHSISTFEHYYFFCDTHLNKMIDQLCRAGYNITHDDRTQEMKNKQKTYTKAFDTWINRRY